MGSLFWFSPGLVSRQVPDATRVDEFAQWPGLAPHGRFACTDRLSGALDFIGFGFFTNIEDPAG